MAQANFFAPGFDDQIEAQNIERQRRYADLLREQSQQQPQGQMVSGHFVAPSWTQQLAQVLKAYQGGKGSRDADERQKALAEAVRGRNTQDMGQFTKLLSGTPAQATGQQYQTGANEMGDEAATVPQWQGAQGPDMKGAYAFAAGAQNPALQQVGLRGLAEMPQLEAKAAELAENRAFRTSEREAVAAQRMQEMQQNHALRMQQMQEQNASRQQMMEEQRAFQLEMKKLQASQGSSSQPYFQPVQTANGVMAFNARTGRVEPVMAPDGKPVVGAAADPTLQGAIAGAKTGATTEAKSRTEARLEAPQAVAQAEEAIKLVDDLLKAPGFKQAVGGSRLLGIQKIPGTDAKDFDVRLDQLKGKQFLQAFESLKGGGQITEVEGKKATDAIARMDAASSEAEFTKAAKEFQGVIRQGMERAKQKGGVATTAPPTAPKTIRFDVQGNRLP
jgi:hypothetical protein